MMKIFSKKELRAGRGKMTAADAKKITSKLAPAEINMDDGFDDANARVIRRGAVMGRPKSADPKRAVTVRYDSFVIDGFKKLYPNGWQTAMNDTLGEWLRMRHGAI